MPRRARSNPLAYRQGIAPQPPAAPPEPQQWGTDDDLAAGLFDPAARQAVSIVERRYGIKAGSPAWGPRHDTQALRIRAELRNGRPVHELDPRPAPQRRPEPPAPWTWSDPAARFRR